MFPAAPLDDTGAPIPAVLAANLNRLFRLRAITLPAPAKPLPQPVLLPVRFDSDGQPDF